MICDAIIRAQDVMHSSPKLVVRLNKRKERVRMVEEAYMGKKVRNKRE